MNKLKTNHSKQQLYVAGFVGSLMMTLIAYLLVSRHLLSSWVLFGSLIVLALIQLIIQLYCFLHLGQEVKPRWNLVAFGFMIIVVGILVAGSLWIMQNLDYNHPHVPSDQSIIQDEGGHQ